MLSIKTICIAGKNEIAIYGAQLAKTLFPDDAVVCLCNRTDLGYDTWQPSLKKYASDNGIPIVTLEECYQIDNLVFISLEFDKIVNPELFLSTALYNIHFSNLPKYRGMYTSALPLLHGAKESGVTLHLIDEGIDTGAIIDQIEFSITDLNSARDLYFSYLSHAQILLKKNLVNLVLNNFSSAKQSSSQASYFSKTSIDYSALSLNFQTTASQVKQQVCAFNFREYQLPICFDWEINKAEVTRTRSTLAAGNLVAQNNNHLIVATTDYDITLFKDYQTAFFKCSKENLTDCASKYISKINTVDIRDSNGWTPLIVACYAGSLDMVKFLILHNADINLTNYKGTTPLMYAFSHYEKSGDSTVFKFLIETNANRFLADIYGKTLRDYMLERNNLDLISLLD